MTVPALRTSTWIVLLCSLAWSTACKRPDEANAATTEKAEYEVPVEVAVLEHASFTDAVQIYGRIDALKRVSIAAEIPGRIDSVPKDNGDAVGRGQAVVRIGARAALAQRKQAEASLNLARAELARLEKMVAKKLATEQQLSMQRAQVQQAEAAHELADVQVGKAIITSPIAGRATNVTAKPGEMAQPGMPLLEVVDLRKVVVEADVPEQDIVRIEPGAVTRVWIEALGQAFEGPITEVGLVANGKTRTFPVEITLDNKEGRLRPGMMASLELVRRHFDDTLVVPRDAVIDDVDKKLVFVDENGVARSRVVTLGPARGAYVVVDDGLEVGDRLIVLGQRQVVDGQKVTVNKEMTCCRRDAPAPVVSANR